MNLIREFDGIARDDVIKLKERKLSAAFLDALIDFGDPHLFGVKSLKRLYRNVQAEAFRARLIDPLADFFIGIATDLLA